MIYKSNKTQSTSHKLFMRSQFVITSILLSVFYIMSTASAATWDIERELKKFVENRYPWEDIEIRDIQVLGKLKEESPAKIVVEKGPIGKAVFSIIYDSGERIFTKAYIRAFDWVVKSKRPFRKGHVLKDDEIFREKVDIRKIRNDAIKDKDKIIGKSLRRSIVANIPLSERMVENAQVVKRGTRVLLLINYGGLKITAAGKTKEKGFVGSAVTAINLSSKREVRGVLIDENTVKVIL